MWKTPIPGLAHSAPVIWDGRVFITTAISSEAKPDNNILPKGSGKSSSDLSKHTWKVFCLDLRTGKIQWEKTAYEGVPKIKRHPTSTQANATPADRRQAPDRLFRVRGALLLRPGGQALVEEGPWRDRHRSIQRHLVPVGAASSPIIYKNLVIMQCDQRKGAFLAAFELQTGKEVWRDKRDEYASWSTPVIFESKGRVELVTSSPLFSRGHDPLTGKELWKLGSHSAITVPTPVVGKDVVYIADGYGRPGPRPIYAVRPGIRATSRCPRTRIPATRSHGAAPVAVPMCPRRSFTATTCTWAITWAS